MGKLRRRCEDMLTEKEQIVLDAECSLIQPSSQFPRSFVPWLGAGRMFLTGSRLIWIRRGMRMPWIPDLIEIPLSSIEDLRLITGPLAPIQIRIRSAGKEYFCRLGTGPYPLLRRNPQTTEQWFQKLEALMQVTKG